MADNKQLQQVHEASWDVVNSLRETNQTVADSLVALQDRNLKFTQNIFLSWADVLTQQTESTRRLQQQWGQQIRVQQEAFQRLTSTLSQVYVDFLLTPLAFSRALVEATESAIGHEEKESRKASR